jgi:copper(I)-binding protein
VKGRVAITCAAVALIAAAPAARLSSHLAAQGKRVSASESWVKLPGAGETGAMAFVAIENPTMYGIYVTSASSESAGKIELRDGSQPGDARLKPVEFLSVPAYDRLDMSPGGSHLMLLDLKRPLKEGDRIAIALATDNAGTLEVTAVVKRE